MGKILFLWAGGGEMEFFFSHITSYIHHITSHKSILPEVGKVGKNGDFDRKYVFSYLCLPLDFNDPTKLSTNQYIQINQTTRAPQNR